MNQRRKRKTKKQVLIITRVCFAAFLLCFFLGGLLFTLEQESEADVQASSVPLPTSSSQVSLEPVVTTLKVSATGDNLIHDGLYLQARSQATDGGYDFQSLYQHIAPFYQDFDINWINQETLVVDETTIAPSSYPCFATPSAMGKQLYEMGFRVFSLSNNHSYDKGADGIASTIAFWDSMPEDVVTTGFYAGESDYENIPLQTIDGVTIAYLAYTYGTNGIPQPNGATANIILNSQEDVMQHQIELARTQADIVVVGVHWGTEGSHIVHDTQRTLGQKIANWGADIIIGTHPHVIQSIETFTNENTGQIVPVAYSLGNFVSTQVEADNLIGIILTFDITKITQPDETFTATVGNVHAVPMVMYYDASYKNATAYLYRDYTNEIAATHCNRNLKREYIQTVLTENISEEYLVLS